MRKGIVRLAFGSFLTLFVFWAAPAVATPIDGYVCEVTLYTNASGTAYGSYGSLLVTFNSSANCAGVVVATGRVCTTGASLKACASSADDLNEAQLLAVYQSLQRAADSGQRVAFNKYIAPIGAVQIGAIIFRSAH